MAYRPHILLAWGGRLGADSGEIWQNTMRFVTNSTDVADLQDLASSWGEVVAPELITLMGNGGYSVAANLDWIKANAIDATGHQPNTATNVWYSGTDFTGRAGSRPGGPYQVSVAVSFVTAAVRGRGSRGRCFVPTGTLGSGADFSAATGLMDTTFCNSVRDGWAAFINALDDNPGPDFANLRAAVVSKLGSDDTGWHQITGVKVGRVPDTQRRRRNALNEDYTSIATVSP